MVLSLTNLYEDSHHIKKFFNSNHLVSISIKQIEHVFKVLFSFSFAEEKEKDEHVGRRDFSFAVSKLKGQLFNSIFGSFRKSHLKHLNEVLLIHLSVVRLVHDPVVVALNYIKGEKRRVLCKVVKVCCLNSLPCHGVAHF